MANTVRRRDVAISLGAVALLARTPAAAQGVSSGLRRVGVMMAVGEGDPEGQARLRALQGALADIGWSEGRNVTVTAKWYQGSFETAKADARALIALGTEVLVVNGTPGMEALRGLGTNIPTVFVVVSNPVGAGYVSNLSRPGGNVTGFSTFEPEIAGKWLQFLRQITPGLKNVSMLLDPKLTSFNTLWQAVTEIASGHGIAVAPAYASTMAEIEREVEQVARREVPALIVSPSPINTVNRKRLIELGTISRLPMIFPFRFYVHDGALIAYGFNAVDQFRRAADYVDRILKGEKAGDLPVQAPSLFELGINLRTAKAMGIFIPQALLIAADEIVE